MRTRVWVRITVFCVLITAAMAAQDGSTGAIRGTVSDAAAARIAGAHVMVTNSATGITHATIADSEGTFVVQMLPPGEYGVRVEAPKMAPQQQDAIVVNLGAAVELRITLAIAGVQETVNVSGGPPTVETVPSAISNVIPSYAIAELPLNGRRFTDLALLTPGVTQDPRGLTSASNGDLSFGGIRGFQTSFLVDGVDNNNGFFSQAAGRYRAPYQFSNEVVQEFRVSSNTYGAELGRSGSAVINVATKSGSNHTHGSAFYYLRDSRFNAREGFMDFKPADRQQQFGGTIGGPIKKNRIFYFAGFDQHVFHVPTVVYFLNGTPTVTPLPADYEVTDHAQVAAAAQQLSTMGGDFRTKLLGNSTFAKLDAAISPRQFLSARLSTSRYYGANNVYFDPASPITPYAVSENGEENVATESASISLTSGISYRLTSHLRMQFSRDLQQSSPNSTDVEQKVYGLIEAFGRSTIMPRETNQHRLHVAETINRDGKRNSWKFGGDVSLTWIRNYFPLMFGGEYIFDNIRVNPFTFAPMTYGMKITPLRAYAHQVPRYYMQNFGSAVSHPDTREYSGFVQDAIRVTSHLAATLGLRYDLQTFRSEGLVSNPLWPGSGKVPTDTNNFAPRAGLAYSFGNSRPLVVRGGWGMFYTRVPQMYNSAVETSNGINNAHLYLDKASYWDNLVFPKYPLPLVSCPPGVVYCSAPANVASKMSTEISAFAPDFETPVVQQASLGVEKEIVQHLAISANYLYVHGEHLIRARDANLPPPTVVQYPVFDESGKFMGQFYTVNSFAPCPPCSDDAARPVPQLGAINVFESRASSIYNGLTVSARRRMTHGVYFRLAYTFARAIDDGQDALVTGSPVTVQNSYDPNAERGLSSTDQRHRFVLSWVTEPQPFHREHPFLRAVFDHWKWSGVTTFGSGRPVSASVDGDPNMDGNTSNDRLPGVSRNSFTGPDYATTDMRITRKLHATERTRLELMAESFNLFNKLNERIISTDNGFYNTAGEFLPYSTSVGTKHYPGYFVRSNSFMIPSSAYAPRQVQFALKLAF